MIKDSLIHLLQKSAKSAPTGSRATRPQLYAGNYRLIHRKLAGLQISIENPAGSSRKGVDAGGTEWKSTMHSHYGYICGTSSADGDLLDCFIRVGFTKDSPLEHVYIINQKNVTTGKFDEHKVMIGWDRAEEAKKAYLACYARGWKGYINAVRMDLKTFKKWMRDTQATSKPADTSFEKKAAEAIPDPRNPGSYAHLKVGDILPYVLQEHAAERAGKHTDVRIGDNRGGLLSWAVRKGVPEPGKKHFAARQPLHSEAYGGFSGKLRTGYGKGTVKVAGKGRVLVSGIGKDGITLTTADSRYPERFRLQRMGKGKDRDWLLINVTPVKFKTPGKVHMKRVPAEDVESLFSKDNRVSSKVDGSAEWLQLMGDHMESLSYRKSEVTGRPIVHTERMGLHKLKDIKGLPKDTLLRSEAYAVKGDRVEPASKLGGLLNATVERSLVDQKREGMDIRHHVYDILRHKGQDISGKPYEERLEILKDVLDKLPKDKFHLADGSTDPEEQRSLWARIIAGEHPLTSEGIVAQPLSGGRPSKVKVYPESDVVIKSIFPGKGKYEGSAGGFSYALADSPDTVVGKVGSGFSDEDRKDMAENPDAWIGRISRIRSQGQFKGGAHRAPAFISRHEG